MEALRNVFAKPDPQAQVRKCNAILRKNMRDLDRDILRNKQAEAKAKSYILAADKRSQRATNSTQRDAARQEARGFAREFVAVRKSTNRLVTTKAQVASVQMQVNEAFAVRKIDSSIRAGVGVMKNVNSLIRLPQMQQSMMELQTELMKAGIGEEMMGDMLPVDDDALLEGEDEEAESEVDKVLGEILRGKIEKTGTTPVNVAPVAAAEEEEEEESEEAAEEALSAMRNRLEALRS